MCARQDIEDWRPSVLHTDNKEDVMGDCEKDKKQACETEKQETCKPEVSCSK